MHWLVDPGKIFDLLDFLVTKGTFTTYTDVTFSFKLSSDYSPVIKTIGSWVAVEFGNAMRTVAVGAADEILVRRVLSQQTQINNSCLFIPIFVCT